MATHFTQISALHASTRESVNSAVALIQAAAAVTQGTDHPNAVIIESYLGQARQALEDQQDGGAA